MWIPIWASAAQAEIPPPLPLGAGPVAAVRAERGAGPSGPWAEAGLGLGADLGEVGLGARGWLPAAVVADGAEARAGAGSPWVEVALIPRRAGLVPVGGLSVTAPWGTAGVVERAWGGSAWGGLRAEAGPAVLWVQGGATLSPGLRPISLPPPPSAGVRRTAGLAHGGWDVPASAATSPARPPPAVADPRASAAAEARASVGWGQGAAGVAAATATASVGEGGADVAVGLFAATSPGRAVQAAVEVGVPVVSARVEGTRASVTLSWRP